jgi:predicted enzyme related to lactoylglutathione lyase
MGNAFCHIELSTANVDAAKKFYKSIFDWKLSDMPMGPGMTYTMIGVGKGVGGGMQTHPMPGAPTSWVAYVEVADVKKVIDKARAGGAQIVVEYMPVGDMGSIGIFVDPQGATLGVWAPTKKPAAKKAAKPAKKAKKKAKKAAKPAKKAKKKKGKK